MSGTFSWLTPPASAALALLRLRAAPAALLDRAAPDPGRARFARLLDPARMTVDEVVAWRLADDALELSTHGGPGLRAAITACLRAHGLREEAPTVEVRWDALAHAASPAAARWLLRHGPEAEPPFPRAFLSRPPVILITGPANAGKSTLLNAWCGRERALVSDLPGTTRDLLAAEALAGGWRLRLYDSAGLRSSSDPLERAGQDLVASARAFSDLVLYLRPPGDETPLVAGDLDVHGKADLFSEMQRSGVLWSSIGLTDRDPQALLRLLEDAVLARLGLTS